MKHRELMAEAGGLFDEGLGYKAVASRLCVPKGTARSWEYAYWIGYTYLDDSGRIMPAFLNSTGVMYPSVE